MAKILDQYIDLWPDIFYYYLKSYGTKGTIPTYKSILFKKLRKFTAKNSESLLYCYGFVKRTYGISNAHNLKLIKEKGIGELRHTVFSIPFPTVLTPDS